MNDNKDKNIKEIVVEASTERLREVLGLIEGCLEEAGCSMKTQMQIAVAVEEIFVNIALYAYAPKTGTATVRIEISGEPAEAAVTFIDRGVPYDPLKKPDPDVTLSAKDRQIGGLGIYMVKKSMDDMRYEYKDGQNVLTIRKKL